MKINFQKLKHGKQFGYEVLFKTQNPHATGKTGVIIAEMGLPEVYEAEFYSHFMEHVFRYILPPFLVKMILADKGIGLIDPENPLAREEFSPRQLIDSTGSFTNRAGVPYVDCPTRWKPANLKNPWDHGYFLYTGDGPNGLPDVCDKVGAKVVGWYYGRLIPEKRVSWRSQLRQVYDEAVEKLSAEFPGLEFRNAFYMSPQSLKTAVDELVAAGCETIVYQGINCPLYTDFEDYGYVLPTLHELAGGLSRVVMADQLGNQPAYRQAYFHLLRDRLAEATPAILTQNEELGDLTDETSVCVQPQLAHQHKAGHSTRNPHQKGIAPRLTPVVIKVAIPKTAVFINVGAVELAVVVLAQLHQVAEERLRSRAGLRHDGS